MGEQNDTHFRKKEASTDSSFQILLGCERRDALLGQPEEPTITRFVEALASRTPDRSFVFR